MGRGRENESGDRGPMPPSKFRSVVTDDTQGLKTITIVNYDPYVVEQEKMVMSLDAVALKEAQHTASTSTTSMDMANEILAEVGMMASP